jgi:hypothetical protein
VVEARAAAAQEAADPVADLAMAVVDPDPEQGQDQVRVQGQDPARVKDRAPVRVTGPATEQAKMGLVPVMGQASDQVVRVKMQVTDPAMAPAMMEKALRTAQVLDRIKQILVLHKLS